MITHKFPTPVPMYNLWITCVQLGVQAKLSTRYTQVIHRLSTCFTWNTQGLWINLCITRGVREWLRVPVYNLCTTCVQPVYNLCTTCD
jgi:hypothetical protein